VVVWDRETTKGGALSFDGLPKALFSFLADLARNNNRDWFQRNKARYEADALAPMLALIEAMQPLMKTVSAQIDVIASKSGGSLGRIYRDVRFSKDKSPYQTYLAAQFRHVKGRSMNAPGFYVHLHPKESFLGVGIWQPEGEDIARIRAAIASDSKAWQRARDDRGFRSVFSALAGASLKRPPSGYPADHPCIEDLKRKDFVAFRKITIAEAAKSTFPRLLADCYRASSPLMRFVCDALRLAY